MLRCSPCRYPICTCTCNIKDISERMHTMRSCIWRTYTMKNRIEHDHWEWIRYPLIMDARATTPAVLGPTTPFYPTNPCRSCIASTSSSSSVRRTDFQTERGTMCKRDDSHNGASDNCLDWIGCWSSLDGCRDPWHDTNTTTRLVST